MRGFIPIILIVIILSAASCEYACVKAELYFGLVGFSDAESDTIILRRFTKNGNSSVMKDTFLLNDIWFQRSQDTLKMVGFPGTAVLESDYDYEFYFPGAGRLIKVTDIKEEQLYGRSHGKTLCGNKITGYTLDGRVINNNIDPFNTIIYLTK